MKQQRIDCTNSPEYIGAVEATDAKEMWKHIFPVYFRAGWRFIQKKRVGTLVEQPFVDIDEKECLVWRSRDKLYRVKPPPHDKVSQDGVRYTYSGVFAPLNDPTVQHYTNMLYLGKDQNGQDCLHDRSTPPTSEFGGYRYWYIPCRVVRDFEIYEKDGTLWVKMLDVECTAMRVSELRDFAGYFYEGCKDTSGNVVIRPDLWNFVERDQSSGSIIRVSHNRITGDGNINLEHATHVRMRITGRVEK